MSEQRYGRIRHRPRREFRPKDKPETTKGPEEQPVAPPQVEQSAEKQPEQVERPMTSTPRPTIQDKPPPRATRRPLNAGAPEQRRERTSRDRPPTRRPVDKSRRPASRERATREKTTRTVRKTPPTVKTLDLKFQSIALPMLTIMVATAFFYYAAPILVPLIAAIAFAYILSPVVELLKRARIPHVLAVLIVMVVGAALLCGAGYLIVQESVGLASDMPGYYEAVKGWMIGALESYRSIQLASGNLLPVLDESLLEGITFADFSGVGAYLFKGIGSVLSSVLGLVMIVLLTLFLLLDQQALKRRLSMVLGGDPLVSTSLIEGINTQIRGFLIVKFATTLALAILFTVGLLFFGVNYAYVWGPLAAVLNLIPYVGAIIGMIPPVIVAAIQTGGITIPAGVLLFFVVIQLMESNVITPKLVGDKVNLNLLAVLLSTLYWGWLWGMLGIILAVPITAAAKVICAHVEPLRPIAILLGGEPGTSPTLARRR